MGRRRRRRQQRRDRISELPADILDMILGFLPIEEAARMAVLSTLWRDIWFNLTQLNFDVRFFSYHIKRKYSHSQRDFWTPNIQRTEEEVNIWMSASFYVVNKVLNQHNGLIRKFVFGFKYTSEDMLLSRSFDINQWLLFVTQKGVEEIHLSLMPEDDYILPTLEDKYRVPNYIISCPTLRKLHLCGVFIEPINDSCILPNVTSLCFEHVDFSRRNHPADVPMLENLSLIDCRNMLHFNITAPKLGCLKLGDIDPPGGVIPVNLDLRSVRTLDLDSLVMKLFVEEFTRRGLRLQPVLNVECLILSNYSDWEINFSDFINLLQVFPKLCTLDIPTHTEFGHLAWKSIDSDSKLLEEFYSVAQTLKMLRTLKFSSVLCWETCMFTMLEVFSQSPKFEKVVIIPYSSTMKYNYALKFIKEFAHFPRASTKALVLGKKRKLYTNKNPIVFLLK